MSLKFGDPESIAARDKARHDAEFITCETCHGCGFMLIDVHCKNETCEEHRHRKSFDIETECRCCAGEGEITRGGKRIEP